ncbi:hypothetical protein DSAG12_01450 [Promethearchaeum syntrophicum]|uniref:Uncharacterized protein n=1 Tax=Promethearchaeum syntrophicum TaxID=2594042 RepID=A0A5B9D923_9ARCH
MMIIEDFYEEQMERNLRLGDIVKGIAHTHPIINTPFLSIQENSNFKLEISNSEFLVILTPCCSIGPQFFSLAPLFEIHSTIFNNPYFYEDLTRINRLVAPKNAITKANYLSLTNEEKAKYDRASPTYSFKNFFIFKGNPFFKSYIRNKSNIYDYMIDFTRVFYVESKNLKGNGKIKKNFEKIKILQLSVDIRHQLRLKLSHYYGRVPDEDLPYVEL